MGYSAQRKESVLKKLLPPNNVSIAALSKEEGISDATLYSWCKQARNQGRLMPDSDNSSSNNWSSRDKLAAVIETAAMSQVDIAAYCRAKGLYPEQLIQWKKACEQANDWDQSSEKKLKEATQSERKKNKQLQKELARKEKALAEAAALLVLRKKYNALFEDHEDES
jgi:transposase-like protein